MSALGHKQTFAAENGMSALPPKADKARLLLCSLAMWLQPRKVAIES
jgi:hypothetical protein